jgi:hypothetical protein
MEQGAIENEIRDKAREWAEEYGEEFLVELVGGSDGPASRRGLGRRSVIEAAEAVDPFVLFFGQQDSCRGQLFQSDNHQLVQQYSQHEKQRREGYACLDQHLIAARSEFCFDPTDRRIHNEHPDPTLLS